MKIIKSRTLGGIAIFGILSFAPFVHAVPYASTITTNTGQVTFYLNESADNVKVVLHNPENTVDLGGLSRGPHTFSLGSSTGYQIEVTKSTPPVWTQISDDTNTLMQFFSPGGIAINKNPKSLSLFGRIYVAENAGGHSTTKGIRDDQDGIYILNPDYSDTFVRGDGASTAGIFFTGGTAADGVKSPWKIEIGEDDNLYIADWSLANANVWQVDPDVTTAINVLDGIGSTGNPTVHTTCNGSAIVKGSLSSGNLTVWAIDGSWGAGKFNRLLRWDIGAGPLPYANPPAAELGTAGVPSVADVQSDLDIAPDGKFFLSQNRDNGTSGVWSSDRVNIRVYDTDGTTLLWDSLTNSLAHGQAFDLFRLARSIKVSPDGKKVAVARNDTQTWIIGLTNGIPDYNQTNLLNTFGAVSTSTANRREVAFDAAGNLYVGNNSYEVVRVWSPGGTTTAITRSDGTFEVPVPATTITATTSTPTITEGGGTNGVITLTRAGDTTGALTVAYTLSGTSSNGVDFTSLPGSVTFAAGATSTNIFVTPTDDSIAETTETVVLTLGSGTNYSIGIPSAATISILDDETPQINLVATQPKLLEGYASSKATLQINRVGLLSSALTVNIGYTGPASRGVDFDGPLTVNLGANATSATFNLTPIDDSSYEGAETINVTVASGSGYTAGTTNAASVSVIDDEFPTGTTLFSENFDDPNAANNWTVFNSDGGGDTFVDWAFDYSAVGIPKAPHSATTTKGVRFRVNESFGTIAAESISPNGQNFTGDYRLSFDMWLNYDGRLDGGGPGSTQAFNAGAGTTGDHLNAPVFGADGGFFSVTGDGGSGVASGDYNAYENGLILNDDSGVYLAGTNSGVRDNFNAYYNLWGNIPAPAAQVALYPQQTNNTAVGSMGMAWHRVAVTKQGETLTWTIDGVSIAAITNTVDFPFTTTGNIFVGYSDPFASVATDNQAVLFALVDNLTVESVVVPGQNPNITSVQVVSGTVQIDFTGAASDAASAFTLQSTATVDGTFADESGATITQLSPGSFRATITTNGSTRFYRIKR